MALQSSGAISLLDIRTELGAAGAISLGDTAVRTLGEVPSGAISMSNFYGKSDLQEVVFDNAAAAWGTPQDWNLWNIFVYLGIAITSKNIKVTLKNITISSTATSIPALETGTGWPTGTNLHVYLQNASVLGRGGNGGAGGFKAAGAPGGAGGAAMRITGAISGGTIKVELGATCYIRAGGGGGGGGSGGSNYVAQDGTSYFTGGTGGRGAGTLGAQTAGTNPSTYSGAGGSGGSYGANGANGIANDYAGGTGGAAGAALVNNSLATKVGWSGNYWGALA